MLKGISSALFAAFGGLLVVEAIALIIWMAEPRASAPLSAALRTGAAFWLLGHGGRLHLPAGTAALIPLGLTALFAAFIARAGSTVAKARPSALRRRTIVASSLAVSVPYALTVTLVAGISGGGGLEPSVVTALIGGLVLALVFSAIGAARELPAPPRRPNRYRAIAAGVVTSGLVLAAAAALLAGIALALHISDAAALAKPEKAGAIGGLGLLSLQAALAPNAVVWSGSYLLGPGFSVGAGTLVSPTSAHLGDVPGLPMLASLPAGAGPWPVYLLFAIPVAAGVVGGAVIIRRLPRIPTLPLAALLSSAAAVLLAGLNAGVGALSGGAVTRGRLSTVGPSAWHVAVFTVLEMGVPCVLTALAVTSHRQRQVAMAHAGQQPVGWRRRLRDAFGRLGASGRAAPRAAARALAVAGGTVARRLRLPSRRKAAASAAARTVPAPTIDLTRPDPRSDIRSDEVYDVELDPDPPEAGFAAPPTEPPTEPVIEPVIESATGPATEPLPVVDAGLLRVDLVKHPNPPAVDPWSDDTDRDPGETDADPDDNDEEPVGVIAPALAAAAARAKRFVPRMPKRRRRRKVIKLPD